MPTETTEEGRYTTPIIAAFVQWEYGTNYTHAHLQNCTPSSLKTHSVVKTNKK